MQFLTMIDENRRVQFLTIVLCDVCCVMCAV
jgi:hypothetical protein